MGSKLQFHKASSNSILSIQSAFTLIELSIVLVIIGLIVGGVLTGRDLISAAETRATIAQIEI
jgi:prepilin-type N-terminal cleavage/methylation domain-containing protein